MNVKPASKTLHIPFELLDSLVEYLDKDCVLRFRLVSRAASACAQAGRVGTCRGYMYEKPEQVAIVTRKGSLRGLQTVLTQTWIEFYDEEALQKYRSSYVAAEPRHYLERLWPSSLAGSTSRRWLLPQSHRGQEQLQGWPYTEVRTVYFNPT